MELNDVRYISDYHLNVLVLYDFKGCKGSILGLLSMMNCQDKAIDFTCFWNRYFKLIHYDPKSINHLVTSSNGQYLALLNGQNNVVVSEAERTCKFTIFFNL